jgi:hypothetical protein
MAIPAKPAAKTAAKPAVKSTATAASPTLAKSPAKPRAKAVAKPCVSADTAEPFLRFYHSPELQSKTEAVLTALEQSAEPADHGEVLADLVAELTEAGMSYYYLRALKGHGFLVEQSARLAMSGGMKLISSVSRKFIVRMDGEQLLAVAQHIRHLAR